MNSASSRASANRPPYRVIVISAAEITDQHVHDVINALGDVNLRDSRIWTEYRDD